MTTQLVELERPEQLNRFAYIRGEASNIVSAYLNFIDQSSDPRGILAEVEQNLNRLSTTRTQGTRSLSSEQVMQAVKASELISTYRVAGRLEKDDSDITRYRVLVGTVLAFTLQRRGLISDPPIAIDWAKYNSLGTLYEETDAITNALEKPEVSQQLKYMPDLKSLLETFQNHSTVEPFLEENRVFYPSNEVARFNSELRSYLFSNQPFAISPLLRKATFSRWINRHTDWYDAEADEVDGAISQGAEFIYSVQASKRRRDEVCSTRAFLKEVLIQGFEESQKDLNWGHEYSLDEMFVSKNGCGIKKSDDIDIAKTFSLFADVSYCPAVLKSMVRRYVEAFGRITYDSLATDSYKGLGYTRAYLQRLIERGFVFLENILRLGPNTQPALEDLTITGRERLRNFRPMFQKALPEGYTRLQRS